VSRAFALSRTTRLINRVFFDGEADEDEIARGLAATTVRLLANAESMFDGPGQAALIGAFQLIGRMGIGIELDVPDAPVFNLVRPLRLGTLRASLLELGEHLIPETTLRTEPGTVAVTFAFGTTPCAEQRAIYVYAGDFDCHLTCDRPDSFPSATGALGSLAAAAATATIALEHALPEIERTTGIPRSRRPRPSPGPPVHIDLRDVFPALQRSALAKGHSRVQLGGFDAMSGGAITNALTTTLLQMPKIDGDMRVIEPERTDLSNVNRYLQLRADEDERAKIDVLHDSSTRSLRITGIQRRFTDETRDQLVPLRPTVFVGVDDIPSRWLVQEEWPESLIVGATNDQEAVVTIHRPVDPCVGCAHPDPLPPNDEFIPTISFVSFWAGLLQVCALLAELAGGPTGLRFTVFPFGLGGRHWYDVAELGANERCPVRCPRSLQASAALVRPPDEGKPPSPPGVAR
jgi:molybdopterin/thiamine biosynthesis adenylyltransferase